MSILRCIILEISRYTQSMMPYMILTEYLEILMKNCIVGMFCSELHATQLDSLVLCCYYWNDLGIDQFLHWQYLQHCSKNGNIKTYITKSHIRCEAQNRARHHIPTMQYFYGISRNTQCVWDFQNNGMENAKWKCPISLMMNNSGILRGQLHTGHSPFQSIELYFLHLYLSIWLFFFYFDRKCVYPVPTQSYLN